jgi:RNA polymerase sigma-70 factor, ECF subfamily
MVEERRQAGNEREREEDSQCVIAFLAGDKHMFDRLVLRYQHRVFNLCYRFLGDYDEADDCAQEAFVKVFRSLRSFRFDSSFATWLYSITVNTCKNRLKAADYRHRKKMVSITPMDGTDGKTPPYEIEDDAPSPFSRLEAKESELLLQRAIDSLPQDAKTVIILRDIEGLSYEEIAHVTGYNLGTVKSKLARSRQQLRQMLREEKD